MIAAGARAPAFALPDDAGRIVTLTDLRGQAVVLAFYPLDFSPVCTVQLTAYSRALPELETAGARLFGVSVDSAFCHRAFRDRLGLGFPLLADFHPKGEVARRFGVLREDAGMAERALVLVGPDGTVRWSHRAASPLDVPAPVLVLDALAAHSAA